MYCGSGTDVAALVFTQLCHGRHRRLESMTSYPKSDLSINASRGKIVPNFIPFGFGTTAPWPLFGRMTPNEKKHKNNKKNKMSSDVGYKSSTGELKRCPRGRKARLWLFSSGKILFKQWSWDCNLWKRSYAALSNNSDREREMLELKG